MMSATIGIATSWASRMAKHEDFETLAIPHLDAAHALARWLMRNDADAEDVVQEAFLSAFRAFATFSGPDIKPWLLRIVRNPAYRRLSMRKRASNVVSIDEAFRFDDDDVPGEANIPSRDPTPEEHLLAGNDRSLARIALASLQPVHREVLVLREVEELGYRDIAEIVGVPVGTVMSRLARARAELRRAFLNLSRKHAQ